MKRIVKGIMSEETRGATVVLLFYFFAIFPGWFLESVVLRGVLFLIGTIIVSIYIAFKAHINKEKQEEDDSIQSLLPCDIQSTWKLVPRDIPYQLFLIGNICGVAATISVFGIFLDNALLYYLPIPIGVMIIVVQDRFVPWPKKSRVGQIQKYLKDNRG